MIICETLVIHEEEVAMVYITCSHGIFRFRIIQCSTILGHQKFLFSPKRNIHSRDKDNSMIIGHVTSPA